MFGRRSWAKRISECRCIGVERERSDRVSWYFARVTGRPRRQVRRGEFLTPGRLRPPAVEEAEPAVLSAGAQEWLFVNRFFLPYLPPNRPPNWDNVLVRFMIDQEGQWRKGVFHEKKKDDLQIRLNTCLDGVVPPDILENWLSRLKNLGFDRTAVEGASFHIDRRRGIPAEVLIETERVLQEILEYLDSRFGRFGTARS